MPQDRVNKNQLKQDVDILIKQINANSNLNLAIIPKETDPPWFEISIEYKPYSNNKPYFQRRISLREADTIAWNIFYIIKDHLGYEFSSQFEWVKPREEGAQYSDGRRDYYERSIGNDDIPLHKKVHVRMLFAE